MDIVCFGELLLRLGAPGRERWLQQPALEVRVGGAEANVAVSLARLGHRARMVGTLPANPLGEAAAGELRRHGVDTGGLAIGPGRMGLYFLQAGAGPRPSEVLYDRAGSAFAQAAPGTYDWDRLLAGADWLHLSGITPALGAGPAAAAAAAVAAANRLGVRVCFDGNYRTALWQASGGDAPALLRPLLAGADLVLADHRDMALVLGRAFDQDPESARVDAAAAAAFAAFPRLQRFACTQRTVHGADHHALSARLLGRDGEVQVAGPVELAGIVDRIGAGDAFAAGLLHALDAGHADALRFALAAAAIKHSTPGDFNLASAAEIEACAAEGARDVRR